MDGQVEMLTAPPLSRGVGVQAMFDSLRRLFRRGGCPWEPFEITASEWGEVAHALQALPRRRRCRFVEPPEWVKTFDDWNTWILIYNYGYPEEFRHLAQESRALQRAHEAALKDGPADRGEALRLRAVEANEKLADFVMKHRRKKEQ